MCDVLEEMRKCYETRNFCPMLGLIEEAQSMANKMEAGLNDKKDLRTLHEEIKDAKKELRTLKEDIKKQT